MTAETLRHYDRIGLVRPSKVDEWTGYRYYTQDDLIRLKTIQMLQEMDISLKEIKRLLGLGDLKQIAVELDEISVRAQRKTQKLKEAKERIERARIYYMSKAERERHDAMFFRELPRRKIMISRTLNSPALDNLWNYHRHFFGQLKEEEREAFAFEDIAGVYRSRDESFMFAVCERYRDSPMLRELPQGRYLCAECAASDANVIRENLLGEAQKICGQRPQWSVDLVVIDGILSWGYEVQVLCPGR